MPRRHSAVLALLFVYVVVRVFWTIEAQPWVETDAVEALVKLAVWVAPAALAAAMLDLTLPGRDGRLLGLQGSVRRGLLFGVIATLPMAAVAPFTARGRLTTDVLLGTVLIGPLAEEVLFRGFLFTELAARARWPLPWAVAVSGLTFGAAHVHNLDMQIVASVIQLSAHQARAIGTIEAIAIELSVVSAGGMVFAWVFHRYRSIWPAIGLHAMLNFWWAFSRPDDLRVVLRPDLAGAAQVVSLALAVVMASGRLPVVRHWALGQR